MDPDLLKKVLKRRKQEEQKELDNATEKLSFLVEPHVASFNWFLEHGIPAAVADLDPTEVETADGRKIRFHIESVTIGMPTREGRNDRQLPSECRQGHTTYGAPATITVAWENSKGQRQKLQRSIGRMPIMVRSSKCWTASMSPQQLIKAHEDATEPGGYFICNGNEKLVRMLIATRRNTVMAVVRQAFQKKGRAYTTFGTMIRCASADQSTYTTQIEYDITVTCHYLSDGSCMVRFMIRKQEFFLPAILLLKALIDTTDREIYEKVTQGDSSQTFVTERIELNLREFKTFGVQTRLECVSYLGESFRATLGLPDNLSSLECGEYLLRKFVFIHLTNNRDKFDLLIFMIRKLYALVSGECVEDNQDAANNQEVLMAGHLFCMQFKEKLQDWCSSVKLVALKELRMKSASDIDLEDYKYFEKIVTKVAEVGKKIEYFLATGNLRSNSGLDLMQVSGFVIMAERLNYMRFVSHLRCIHRGAFFAEMKTTTVRKLLAESWGFMCPVHTPDGAPCGLLNHLSNTCKVVTDASIGSDSNRIISTLVSFGMTPQTSSILFSSEYLTVMLDGRIVGGVPVAMGPFLVQRLRYLKVKSLEGIPSMMEMALVMPSGRGGQFPGLFLYTSPARMMRPVKYLPTGDTEWIGSFEQIYMDIACIDEDLRPHMLHRELKPTHMLSVVANLTPYSDFNQSPRNMYQCQMAKQSMGTPFHSFPYRTDNKIYRLQTTQAPIARTEVHDDFHMDNYPQGLNAVVAVISYTGYDMEDAMIINKAAYDRGFMHASVYKTEVIDLEEGADRGGKRKKRFLSNRVALPNNEGVKRYYPTLDLDGLPHIESEPGSQLRAGDPLYSYVDETGKHSCAKWKIKELATVEEVRIVGGGSAAPNAVGPTQANIKLRLNRNPIIGDKFSSRHGQKGVLSQLWPQENMPFTESGMSPDIIINPHAFPSRMTIGMLVESMAGKSGALHGMRQPATPFTFHEKRTAIDHFGEQLKAAGYNYYGSEPLYSGMYGTEFYADIYIGLVFYQRLRHMVNDKYQVRAVGPVHNLTHQPIKGRKVGGGIRFGEMERDSLLAHGASFLLHDRLMNSSDYHKAYVCSICGSLLSPISVLSGATTEKKVHCRCCETKQSIRVIALPYVFRYLAVELSAMNIRLVLNVK